MINPYAIIGGLVLLIAVVLGSVQTGRKLERATWQARELAIAERSALDLAIAHERVKRIQLSNEANARKATAKHEQAINDLTEKYAQARAAVRAAGGLRIPASVCPATGADQGTGTSRPDESSPASVALPARVTEDLFILAQQADQLSEQLRALQGWVKDNGHYGEPKP